MKERKCELRKFLGLFEPFYFCPCHPVGATHPNPPPTFILPVTRSHTFLSSLMCTEYIKRELMSQSHWPPSCHRSQLLGELGRRLDPGERPHVIGRRTRWWNFSSKAIRSTHEVKGSHSDSCVHRAPNPAPYHCLYWHTNILQRNRSSGPN